MKRKFRRFYTHFLWPALFFSSFFLFVWLLLFARKIEPTKREAEDYTDHRGIRVVVGHYVGDVGSAGHSINLTDEILNANNFDPKPGAGHNGIPVELSPNELIRSQNLYTINKFNLVASDKIPLNRSLPDVRKKRCLTKYNGTQNLPKTSVIIVFHNEAWSTLLRTVYSVINRSPESALEEILLIDDASTRTFLKESLKETVSRLKVKTRVLRTGKREGLVRARLIGAKAAKGQVLTFLDAHCEVTKGWLEPLLIRVAKNRTHVVCPVIDIINDDTFAYVRSFELHWGAFNWNLHFRWYTLGTSEIRKRKLDIAEPFPTPAMAGGLFAIDKSYFFEIGAYDDRMEIWGGENLELSFRVWQCGGAVEIAPCSHVGHLFRKSSPYSFPGGVGDVLYANLARVALVWMDAWADFYFKFNPDAANQRDHQSVRDRLRLRAHLKCQDFGWYLANVWPHHFFPSDDRFFGQIKQDNRDENCITRPLSGISLNQPSGAVAITPCTNQLVHMFVMSKAGHIMTDESVCLDAPDFRSEKPRVKVQACSFSQRQVWHYDKQTKTLLHNESNKCLAVDDIKLILEECGESLNQKFKFNPIPWN